MTQFPAEFTDLFEKPTIGHLATTNPDGTPHVAPVWVDFDGEHVLVNTQAGCRKERNVRGEPRVALSMTDPDDAYRRVVLRGTVVETRREGAESHKNELSERYLGRTEFPLLSDEVDQVVLHIQCDRVSAESIPLVEDE